MKAATSNRWLISFFLIFSVVISGGGTKESITAGEKGTKPELHNESRISPDVLSDNKTLHSNVPASDSVNRSSEAEVNDEKSLNSTSRDHGNKPAASGTKDHDSEIKSPTNETATSNKDETSKKEKGPVGGKTVKDEEDSDRGRTPTSQDTTAEKSKNTDDKKKGTGDDVKSPKKPSSKNEDGAKKPSPDKEDYPESGKKQPVKPLDTDADGGEHDEGETSREYEGIDKALPKNKPDGQKPSNTVDDTSLNMDTLPRFVHDDEPQSSHFLAYLLTIGILCFGAYLVAHNRHKLMGLLLEGRHGKRRQRSLSSNGKGVRYKRLQEDDVDAENGAHLSSRDGGRVIY